MCVFLHAEYLRRENTIICTWGVYILRIPVYYGVGVWEHAAHRDHHVMDTIME